MWVPCGPDARLSGGMDAVVLPVYAWPGSVPSGVDLLVIGTVTPQSPIRDIARQRVRDALREVLATLLGCDPSAVPLISRPGAPPRLDLLGSPMGLSVTHEPGLSLAAIHLHGPVGIDVMRVADFPDWEALARDYLGQAKAAVLANLPSAARAEALARAWTEHEAALKCQVRGLSEWDSEVAETLAGCRSFPLALPAGYAGHAAIRAGCASSCRLVPPPELLPVGHSSQSRVENFGRSEC